MTATGGERTRAGTEAGGTRPEPGRRAGAEPLDRTVPLPGVGQSDRAHLGPTLVDILRLSTEHLARAGIASPRLDAELILAHVLGISRIDLYLQFDRPLLESELRPIRDLLRRRAGGCPVAYLIGTKEFHSLSFAVSQQVLIPRPESELLVERAASLIADRDVRVLDLGCGSGCLGLTVARMSPISRIDLVDVSPEALEVATRNRAALGVGDRVEVFCGSWADPVRERGPYDLVLSNPPYVATAEWEQLDRDVRDFEPRTALDGGPDGLHSYRELLPSVSQVVRSGSVVLLEGDPRRLGQVAELVEEVWPGAQTHLHVDLSGRERMLEVRVP